jgi:hypothetical protein
MADFTFKRGDTYPFLKAQLKDGNDAPVNLTGATVRLLLKTQGGTPTLLVNQTCTIVDAVAGRVQYEWQAGDTDDVNTLSGEFEVTWSDGEITTFPNEGFFEVAFGLDLGP